MGTIFITLIGDLVIANRSKGDHADEVFRVLHGRIQDEVNRTEQVGDNRYSLRVRSVITELGK